MPRQLDHTDPLARETAAERERLADLYATFGPEQWAAPSLCAGWRVHEVVAHVTMPYRHSAWRVLWGIVAACGDFNRFADRIAPDDTARHPDAELLAALRDNIAHPWRKITGAACRGARAAELRAGGNRTRTSSRRNSAVVRACDHPSGQGRRGPVRARSSR